jgi:nitroreductase
MIPSKAAAQVRQWWTPTPGMDAMSAIRTRRSVRSFTDEDVTDVQVRELLGAAMSAPNAGNEQPWEFVVIRDRAVLGRVGGLNRFASYARNAPVCILVCGNLDYDKYGGFWIEDVSAATQNILLAAHAMGLGAVWTGIHPMEDRVRGFRQLVNAPESVVPMALVVVGHPRNRPEPVDRYNKDRVHTDRW